MPFSRAISASLFVLALAGAPAALAAETANPVTVNDYTGGQKDKAFAAARAQGYSDPAVTMFQAGNFFLKAQKGGMDYLLTVTPQGKVYASTPLPIQKG